MMWKIQPESKWKMVQTCFRSFVENEEVKILWNVIIKCDREIKARKTGINVVNKNERSCAIIDIAAPGDMS